MSNYLRTSGQLVAREVLVARPDDTLDALIDQAYSLVAGLAIYSDGERDEIYRGFLDVLEN